MATIPAAPPKDEKLPPTQPTPEEQKKLDGEKPVESAPINEFTSRFIRPADGKKPKPAAAKKPEKVTPTPPKPKPVVPPTPPALTEEQITEAAARGVASAMKKPEPDAAAIKPDDETGKLPAGEKRRIAVLTEMGKANPEKYKDMAERYKKSLTNLVEYADKWEKDHPGETFNEEDDEHKEWISKNEEGLDWDDDDYTDALAEIKVQKVFGESRKLTETQQAQAKKIQDALPAIATARLAAGKAFLGLAGKEYADIIGADGLPVKEKWDKLNAEDPVKTEIIISSADYVEKLVAENYALFNQIVPFNGQNPMHNAISSFIIQQEQKMAKQSPELQRDAKNRPFMPAAEFWKLPEAQREKYWTFTQKDVEVLLVNGVYKNTKRQIDAEDEKFAKRAKARGINLEAQNGNRPTPPAPAGAAPKPEEENEDDDKPNTPDVPVQPRAPGGGAPQNDAPVDAFTKRFLGKT